MAVKGESEAKDPQSDLLGEFYSAKRVSTPCTVGNALSDMTEEQREKLAAAFASHDIATTVIRRVLAGWGYEFTPGTLQRHRRGDCVCQP